MSEYETDGSPSLADYVGGMFGDAPTSGTETPASTESAPAPAIADTAPATPAVPDGTDAAERPETPGDASETPTEPLDASASPDADPFADATPATYQVDGQTRTYDAIKILGEAGAAIEAKDLPDVLKRLGERDHYVAANQQLYHTQQQIERLSEWKSHGPDGKEVTHTGLQGLVERNIAYDQVMAEREAILDLFEKPERLVAMLETPPEGQPGHGTAFSFNKDALAAFVTDLRKDQRIASFESRKHWESQATAPIQPTGPADYSAQAPSAIQQAAGDLYKHLTAEDKQFLARQLNTHVRDTTPEERRGKPATYTKIIGEGFTEMVQALAQKNAAMAKSGTVVSTAAKDNAARVAAAARGVRPAARPTTKVAAPTEAQTRASEEEAAWDNQQKAAAAAIRRRTA